MVGMTGFEPAASSSRTMRATKLRHIPTTEIIVTRVAGKSKTFLEKKKTYIVSVIVAVAIYKKRWLYQDILFRAVC